jgi:hypothetical protein
MTEEEAANRLCELLNEIEETGHQVHWSSRNGDEGLFIGDAQVAEPPCEDEPWEVRLP